MRGMKLFETRRLIWRVNLALLAILVASHVVLKHWFPGFAAAEYLGMEIGVLEAATAGFTRHVMKKEARLRERFLEAGGRDA